jgi:hypothetical protein
MQLPPGYFPLCKNCTNFFLVLIGNIFLVSAVSKDMICDIQKIEHLWCRLSCTNPKHRNFGVACLCQLAQKINFQQYETLETRSRPASPDRSPPLSGCHSTMPWCQSSWGPPARRRHKDDDGCKDGGAVAARLLVAGRPSALSLPIIEASMPPRWRTSLLAPPPCVGELLLLAGALLEPELLHLVERMMEQEREREERRGHGMELLHPCLIWCAGIMGGRICCDMIRWLACAWGNTQS